MPSAAYRASTPPVPVASSSGWACTAIRVNCRFDTSPPYGRRGWCPDRRRVSHLRMHIEEFADDIALSSATRLPVSARRLSQKVLLILLSGRMWVRDLEGARRDLTGPTWVVWFPGETIEYGVHGETVHWVFAQPTGTAPEGLPRPGSLVRLADATAPGTLGELGTLVHYLDDSPEQTGTTSLVADVVGTGIGVYGLSELVQVVEEADEDLHGWEFAPAGGDQPVRRRLRRGSVT